MRYPSGKQQFDQGWIMASQQDSTEYVRGEMDTHEQERTLRGFIKLGAWFLILSILTVIIVALANA